MKRCTATVLLVTTATAESAPPDADPMRPASLLVPPSAATAVSVLRVVALGTRW
jgi:hypothetical protein